MNEQPSWLDKQSSWQLREWFSKKSPEFFERTASHDFHQFIINIMSVKDVFHACILIKKVSGVEPDSDLIDVLLKFYNETTIDEIAKRKLIKRK